MSWSTHRELSTPRGLASVTSIAMRSPTFAFVPSGNLPVSVEPFRARFPPVPSAAFAVGQSRLFPLVLLLPWSSRPARAIASKP